jgi:DinB superfamily
MSTNPSTMFVQIAISNWELSIKRATAIFDRLGEAEFLAEVAPGKNRAIYLLGHLAAVHDMMLPLLGLGDRHYPFLDAAFVTNADKATGDLPQVEELLNYWKSINEVLIQKLRSLSPEEWLQKHTAVSDEDFTREPHRNRFNLLLSRIGHIQYHLGQLVLLKK